MAVRYIGSKTRVASAISELLGQPEEGGVLVDAMCGSGAVAAAAADAGWRVRCGDALHAATILTAARLTSVNDVSFAPLGGYQAAIDQLNAVIPNSGFVTRTYSPLSANFGPHVRQYFTVANASLIDAIRTRIHQWRAERTITLGEERVLVADLLEAASRVANTAGTYGCFLRRWSSGSLQGLELRPRQLRSTTALVDAVVGDVAGATIGPNDVAYYDPPYTKRQYAAYYHVLETIALGDEPEVAGITGLRAWRPKASAFCYKRKALNALDALVRGSAARRTYLSYSSDGHVRLDDLVERVRRHGDVVVHRLDEVSRYRTNVVSINDAATVTEYLLEVRRRVDTREQVA